MKRAARDALHEVMQVPALYLASLPFDTASPAPIPCTLRAHTSFKALGDQAGTSYQFAERHEEIPRIRFKRDATFEPKRNGVFSVAPGEAYRIDNLLPPDDEYQTAEVVRVSSQQAANLPVPEVA